MGHLKNSKLLVITRGYMAPYDVISVEAPLDHHLAGGLEHVLWFSIQLGVSSSQLTIRPSFFRGVGGSTTNQDQPGCY